LKISLQPKISPTFRFHLLKGDYTAALREVINDDSIPDTLGGTLDVGDFCAKQRALDKVVHSPLFALCSALLG